MSKEAFCVKVSKKEGEKIIALAIKLGLLDKSLEIQREETNLCIPFKQTAK